MGLTRVQPPPTREGLRCCEVAGLQVGDLDYRDRTVRVVKAKGGHERVLPVTSRRGRSSRTT